LFVLALRGFGDRFERGAVLVDDFLDALVTGDNAFDGIGAFNGLHLGNAFEFFKERGKICFSGVLAFA